MCGIAGFVGRQGRNVTSRLSQMASAMIHRGPDDSGMFCSGNAGITMRRLSIVGLDNGRQPILSENQDYAIVGNGEIYNAPSLRASLQERGHKFQTNSDIECALHLFEERGPEMLHELNGMFALAILDRRNSRLFIARDRLGIKPLFYTTTSRGTSISSELPSLRACLDLSERDALDPDPTSLRDYLRYGYSICPRTMHKGIQQLEAGHWAWVTESGVKSSCYWSWPTPNPVEKPIEQWCEELAALLTDSVRLRTMGDVQAGAFLSGGLDSGSILHLLSKESSQSVPAFTIAFDDPKLSEIDLAKLVVEHTGAQHHTELQAAPSIHELEDIFTRFGEPFADISLLPTHRVSRLAARNVKFVLSGDGGDELFAGYTWLHQEKRWRDLPSPLLAAARFLNPLLAMGQNCRRNDLLGKVLRATGDISSNPMNSFLRRKSIMTDEGLNSLLSRSFTANDFEEDAMRSFAHNWKGSCWDLLLDLDRRFYLSNDILAKVDRASMWHSLEARVPLLDHRIVEFACQIPIDLQLGKGPKFGKQVLKKTIQPWLPNKLLNAPKRGFGIPIHSWIQGNLLSEFEERLLDPKFLQLGLVEESSVKVLIDNQRNGRWRNGHSLWALLSLSTWANSMAKTPKAELTLS